MIDERGEDHARICDELYRIYLRKKADYGDSFGKSIKDWGMIAGVIRMDDKMNRIINLLHNPIKVADETIRDTLLDLANYAIMMVMEVDK